MASNPWQGDTPTAFSEAVNAMADSQPPNLRRHEMRIVREAFTQTTFRMSGTHAGVDQPLHCVARCAVDSQALVEESFVYSPASPPTVPPGKTPLHEFRMPDEQARRVYDLMKQMLFDE